MGNVRPSWLYLACSVLTMGISIFGSAVAFSGLVHWDPCTVVGGVIMLPFPLAILFLQYAAAFRKNVRAAKILAMLLFGINGLVVLIPVSAAGEMLVARAWPTRGFVGFLACAFGLALFGMLCAWLNLRWAAILRAALSSSNTTEADVRPFQFSLRELLAWTAIIALICGLTMWSIRGTGPRFVEHATPDEAGLSLPAGASDVCCYRGYRGYEAYEFSIDEAGFFEWVDSGLLSPEAESAHVAVAPITDSFQMRRYPWLRSGQTSPDAFATITHGYCYEWSKEDRAIHFAYDSDIKRAYFYLQTY
jgi:hypothetical protein